MVLNRNSHMSRCAKKKKMLSTVSSNIRKRVMARGGASNLMIVLLGLMISPGHSARSLGDPQVIIFMDEVLSRLSGRCF